MASNLLHPAGWPLEAKQRGRIESRPAGMEHHRGLEAVYISTRAVSNNQPFLLMLDQGDFNIIDTIPHDSPGAPQHDSAGGGSRTMWACKDANRLRRWNPWRSLAAFEEVQMGVAVHAIGGTNPSPLEENPALYIAYVTGGLYRIGTLTNDTESWGAFITNVPAPSTWLNAADVDIGGDADTVFFCRGLTSTVYRLAPPSMSIQTSVVIPTGTVRGCGGDSDTCWVLVRESSTVTRIEERDGQTLALRKSKTWNHNLYRNPLGIGGQTQRGPSGSDGPG